MRKINDFGEKIGGAKKDLWAMFREMSETEQSEMAQKDKLWKRIKGTADISEEVVFWQNAMRRAVKPRGTSNPEGYVRFVLAFKKDVESCQTLEEIENFYKDQIYGYMEKLDAHHWRYISKDLADFFDGNKVLRYYGHPERIQSDYHAKERYHIMEVDNLESTKTKAGFQNKTKTADAVYLFHSKENLQDIMAKTGKLFILLKGKRNIGFYGVKEEAEKARERVKAKECQKSKERFLPPHLENIQRTGSDYRFFRMTDGNVLMARYGLRGGEFGNWATAKDRLGSVNMCYDAFEDLADCLGISYKDISLGGKLAIAFGARGRGNALAHFEPLKNVINMTRLRGAGSLAHEWGHALDWYVGNHYKLHGFMSDNVDSAPEYPRKLIRAFLQNQDGSETNFYKHSKAFDNLYSKDSNGYWSSRHEMFARAFACYVKDKLGEDKSDYLVGHAEYAKDGGVYAYPIGDERKRINESFDTFFADLIAKGLLTPKKEKKEKEDSNVIEIQFFEGERGQLRFC